jgi:hypothetical protein
MRPTTCRRRIALGSLTVAAALALALAGAGCGGADCGPGTVERDGACLPTADVCGEGVAYDEETGLCEVACGAGTIEVEGECVPDGSVVCAQGTRFDASSGTCVPEIAGCAAGTVLVAGECIPEDQAFEADVEEGAEDNGLDGTPGALTLPAIGNAISVHGCIEPAGDDGTGQPEADQDAYAFDIAGPTLVEISIDGVGGLAGGFFVASTVEALAADAWLRLGANLTGDTSRRQVFLPAAGAYAIVAADSRELLLGTPAGGPEACYYLSIATLAVPEPTPLVAGTVTAAHDGVATRFYGVDAAAGALLEDVLEMPGGAVLGDLVQMVDGAYHGAAGFPAGRDLGDATRLVLAGAPASGEVVLVVDPVIDFALAPVTFTLTVRDQGAAALPLDGSVTLDQPADLDGYAWAYFDVAPGELVHLDVTLDGESELQIVSAAALEETGDLHFPLAASIVATLCEACTEVTEWVRFVDGGRYYAAVFSYDDAPTIGVDVTRAHVAPAPLAIGAAITAADLSATGSDWYTLDATAAAWLAFGAAPTSFGDAMSVDLYPADVAGVVDTELFADFGFEYSGAPDEVFGRVVLGLAPTWLVRVYDRDLTATGDETYALAVDDRAFRDLTVAASTPFSDADETIAADGRGLYLVHASAGTEITVTIAPTGGLDVVLDLLDRDESALATVDAGAADAVETVTLVAGPEGWLAFAVSGAAGAGGGYGVAITAIDP